MKIFTHPALCQIAFNWLRKLCPMRCPVVFMELVTQGYETPDAIGFTGDYSILIECKTSRADFLADKKKFFRLYPDMGAGDFRYYLCPENIIQPDDLPEKWGLIWVDNKGRCNQVKKTLTGNIGSAFQEFRFEKNQILERNILYSGLRRVCKTSPDYFYKY